ncbi:WD40 repeat domain-containing protein, partial [Nonomuraea insulae]
PQQPGGRLPGGGLLFAAAGQSGERWAWDLRARRAAYVGEYAVVGPGDRVALVFDGRRSQIRRPGRSSPAPWLDRMPWEYTTFAPTGGLVAIAEETGVQIYDLDGVPTRSTRLRPSPGHLRFSPDGRLLVSTDSDRVRVWRLDDGALLADRQVPASAGHPAQAALSGDGRWLRVLAGHGTVLTLDLVRPAPPADAGAWVCERYGALSREEWARHLPEVPYREAC